MAGDQDSDFLEGSLIRCAGRVYSRAAPEVLIVLHDAAAVCPGQRVGRIALREQPEEERRVAIPEENSGAGTPSPEPAAERPAAPPSPEAAKPAPAPKPAAPVAAKPASPPKPPEPTPEEIAAMRARIVALLEEKKRTGEEVDIEVQHKEVRFTGRVIRIEPEAGFVVLENVDGRRRGLYFILGGHLLTKEGLKVDFPVDGVPR